MTYDSVAQFSQVASLILFIAMFIGVVVYVFWPGHKKKFDKAQRSALDLDGKNSNTTERGS